MYIHRPRQERLRSNAAKYARFVYEGIVRGITIQQRAASAGGTPPELAGGVAEGEDALWLRPLRTFIDSVRLESVIDLPPGLRGRQLEVIVLPGSPPESEPDNMDDDVYLENENKKNEPWNTPKYRAEASKRRQAIEARLSKKKRMSKDEFLELLSRCPVADEEEIEMQDDFKMEMKRWNP